MSTSKDFADFSPQETAIADAAITLIVSQGFDNVSVRKVATATGVAPGTVQYFMGTKEQLLIKALLRSSNRQAERIAALEIPPNTAPLDRTVLILRELLPIGEIQREDAILWIVMSAAASTRKALAATYLEILRNFQDEVVASIHRHFEISGISEQYGDKPSNESVQQLARLVTALVNGLTVDYINIPLTKASADAITSDLAKGLKQIFS